MTIDLWRKRFQHKDPSHTERILDALRKAGLPENEAPPLPDKPSIAVLPFKNLSKDPEQELFSDGLAENIITQLAKIPTMLVIARNSSFTYKGKTVTVQQVGKELGARYVLEGSVQKSENRFRVTAQLIDTKTDSHLWAQEYDRELQDFFQIQDDITLKVVNALQVKLTEGGKDYVFKNRTKNLKAWAAYMKAYKLWEKFTKEDNAQAKDYAKQAIAIDPNYAVAYAGLAWVYLFEHRYGWSNDPTRSRQLAEEYAKKSIDIDETVPLGHALFIRVYADQKKYDQALMKAERCLELAPNDPGMVSMYGHLQFWLGNFEEGLKMMQKVIRLHPFPPPYFLANVGMDII
jgi:adenylate cyclase